MKDRLKRRITGQGGDGGPPGYVRYVGFEDRSGEQKPWETRTLGRRQLSGPSGHFYTFRQKGNASVSHSQWLPARSRKDFQFFKERDEFEVRRDEP